MKKISLIVLTGLMIISLSGCGTKEVNEVKEETAGPAETAVESEEKEKADNTESEEATGGNAGLANPWVDITEEEAAGMVENCFKAPEGAQNVKWSKMEEGDTPLIQMTFDLNGDSFTARVQKTGDATKDISGMYYEWTVSDDITLSNNLKGKTCRYVGENEYADLCTWYDEKTGNSYSLSVVAPDLDGFDIQGVVEAMITTTTASTEEAPATEHVPLDITGCDTFTQILDKLDESYGFANVKLNGTDVLLVSDGTYDYDEEGKKVAIGAEVYYYNDGVPNYAGFVEGGGTAYPMAVYDEKLYVGGNHYMNKMILKDGEMVIDEEAHVEYDSDGKESYFYSKGSGETDPEKAGPTDDDSIFNGIFDEYFDKAEIVYFSNAK
ncbi:MAG: hypothetical protein K6F99_10710 [Lachnospiraceae bacterium]|nr:hypothetical protein [Lachnospiraceae bacterium]